MADGEARARARAALALLDAQHPAEGVRLARAALEALRPEADTSARPAIDAVLERRPARRDREIAPGDVASARAALELVLERDRYARSAALRTGATTLGVIVIVAAAIVLRPGPDRTARASAVYADLPGYGAAMVLDGDPETSWLLPDRTEGSVVIELREPRTISSVRLSSTTNAPYDDRGTRDYVIELARGGTVLFSEPGSFSWGGRSTPAEHHFAPVEGVDRVRVRVETWHRLGGGLAEIELDPPAP